MLYISMQSTSNIRRGPVIEISQSLTEASVILDNVIVINAYEKDALVYKV